MTRSLADDALEVCRLNVAILVAVEVQKSLSDALALQASQHLRELGVRHGVPVLLRANVQCCPLGFPVERQAVFRLVRLPCVVEFVKVDVAGSFLVEEAENDLVLGVRFRKQVLENTPVVDVDLALLFAVCNLEQDAILVALDLVLLAGVPLASPCFRP